MTDPVTAAVATALATKAVTGLTEAGKTAFHSLTRLVRRKLAVDPQSREILSSAERHPDSDNRQTLAEALARAAANDRGFSEQLAALWRHVQEGRTGRSALNIVSGDVDGGVVQARDIHGNVSFG